MNDLKRPEWMSKEHREHLHQLQVRLGMLTIQLASEHYGRLSIEKEIAALQWAIENLSASPEAGGVTDLMAELKKKLPQGSPIAWISETGLDMLKDSRGDPKVRVTERPYGPYVVPLYLGIDQSKPQLRRPDGE